MTNMAQVANIHGSLSQFPDCTFPRYNYTKDRVKTLLDRFKHMGFKTKGFPSDNETSIMEVRSVGSTLHFCISNWTENELYNSTDITQESAKSDPKHVIIISDHKMDLPADCFYGVMLDTGLHIKSDNNEANVIFSSIKELQTNVDRLLERYVLSFLKELFENASSRSTIKDTSGIYENGEEATERLLSDVMAVYKRSCAPRQEWPKVAIQETPVLEETLADDLFKCDASIKGFGYQHDILQIVVDGQYNEKSFEAIRDFLNRHNITKYHINYGPWTETPLCDIQVGNELAVAERRGTLGGFAMKDNNLYALTSRHLLDRTEDVFIRMSDGFRTQGHGNLASREYVYTSDSLLNNNSPFAIAEEGYNVGELDIAAVKIVQPFSIGDKRLKDSRGRHTNTIIFNFQDLSSQEITKQLQSERIHAWTKARLPHLGNITIPIYYVRGMQCRYIVIENEYIDSEEHHAGAAANIDITNPHAFGMPGDSGAIICSDDARSIGVYAYSMFVGKLHNNDKTMYLSLRLQDGLEQLSTNQVPPTESRYHMC